MEIHARSVDGINDLVIADIREELENRKKSACRILDLGTAEGYNIATLAAGIPSCVERFEFVGVDIDLSAFKPSVTETCKLISHDLNKDFSFGAFDIVIATEVIEHVENPYHFIRNALAQLAPNGILYISTPNLMGLYSALRILMLNAPAYFENDTVLEHISMVSELTIRKALEKTRLETGVAWNYSVGFTNNVIKIPTGSMRSGDRSTWLQLPGRSRLLSQVTYFKIQRAV